MAKDREGFTPAEALQFLLDLLKHNDNNNNPYSDYRQVVISTRNILEIQKMEELFDGLRGPDQLFYC